MIFVLLLSTVISCVTGAELIVRPVGETFTKPVGGSIVMTCNININNVSGSSSVAEFILTWLDKNGRQVPSKTGRMYVESEDLTTKKLYITSISESDAGQYSCIAEGLNTELRKSVQLLLFKEITFDDAPATQNIAVNTDALVVCRASGNPSPSISWRVNGQRIQNSARYILTPDGLKILSVVSADEGEYTCRAEVEADGRYDERRITVHVHVPPKMIGSFLPADGVQGTDLYMSCKAEGHPAPTYKFYKNGHQLVSSSRQHIDGTSGAIYFSPVHKDDEGQYNCTAVNDVGMDSSTAQLHVQVPPSIYSLTNVTVIEGQPATLVCLSQGDPIPDMSFLRTNRHDIYQLGTNPSGVVITNPVLGQLELTLRNVTPDDAGNYTCRSRNTVGVDEQQAHLTVQFKPRFVHQQQTTTFAWATKSRNITCHILAEPAPVVEWFRGGKRIETFNETFRAYQLNTAESYTTAYLQVHVRESDQAWIYGTYTCLAKNFLGETHVNLELRRASVPDMPQSVRVIERLPTELILWAEPPEDDGGMPVIGYRIEYEDQVQDFLTDDVPLRIVGLKPSTYYILRVRAVSEVGAGTPVERTELTENIRRPYPVVITSSQYGRQAHEYIVTWSAPVSGGLPITAYDFKYRRIAVIEGSMNFSEPLEDWTWYKVKEDINNPMLHHKLDYLEPNSFYQLYILAINDLGISDPSLPFIFSTAHGGDTEPVQRRATLDIGVVAAVIVFVLVVFLLIIDVSCYFMNSCGLTMFVCVHICGRQQHHVDRGVEEAESEKKPLSDDVPHEIESVSAFHTGRIVSTILPTDEDDDPDSGGGGGGRSSLRDVTATGRPHSDTTDFTGNSAIV